MPSEVHVHRGGTLLGGSSLADIWFIRRKMTVKGPFPAPVVRKFVVLGRVKDTDELSRDGNDWQPLTKIRSYFDDSRGQLDLARERRAEDERSGCDRREGETHPSSKSSSDAAKRRKADRRKPEPEMDVQRKQRHTRFVNKVKDRPRDRRSVVAVTVMVAVVLVFGLGVYLGSSEPSAEVDCDAAPVPGINWKNCRLDVLHAVGADLTGAIMKNAHLASAKLSRARMQFADLSYADLNGSDLSQAELMDAHLVGADLTRANLSLADLRGANLAYAKLVGAKIKSANLAGARLDKAIWVDKRICGENSVGVCR